MTDDDFDLRARAELSLAYEPGQPPAHLLRREPPLIARRSLQRALAALLLAGGGIGTVLAMRPPALVRGAIEHEYYERTLRGSYMEARPLLDHMGLHGQAMVPGFTQLMRPCEIDGRLAYHLTTFFEKGGMVTVFAFDQPVALDADAGWWGSVYWQVVASKDGKPLVMVSQKKKALAVAEAVFAKSPS